MRTRIEYTKENRNQIRENLVNNGIVILEDSHHSDGTYFIVDRNLVKEIDELKADVTMLKIAK